jgi:hypothetical protein
VYNSLENAANKYFITREIHSIIIAKPDCEKAKNENVITQLSSSEFAPYTNLVIRSIYIQKIEVFGPTVSNPTAQPGSWMEKEGNRIHVKTRDYIIKNNLLFKINDRIIPSQLSDNERIIRSLPFIEDVKIIVKQDNRQPDSVDLVLIVKDNWSKGIDIQSIGESSSSFEFVNKNLMGVGHQIKYVMNFDNRESPQIGHEGYYKISNIRNSFFSLNAGYVNSFDEKRLEASLTRDFIAASNKYAGGLSVNRTNDKVQLRFHPDYLYQVNSLHREAWIGRSFLISPKTSQLPLSLILASSCANDKFYERPSVAENLLYNYQNKTLFLFSVSLMKQSFYKTNYLYSYGRTEDIPYGGLLQFTGGLEKNEFVNRGYFATSLSHGVFLNRMGYMYNNLQFGSFLYRGNCMQGLFNFHSTYFSNLLIVNRSKFRFLYDIEYTRGINRNADEYLTINNGFGIRGFKDEILDGNQRFRIKLEEIFFTPYSRLDFKFAIFSFADMAWVSSSGENVFSTPMYSGFGIGLRIHNERLVFKTISIRLAYYPVLSPNAKVENYAISGSDRITPQNFFVNAPSLPKYE